MLDELADFEPEVKGNQVFLSGHLTESGLTRLSTLIKLPTAALHVAAKDPSEQSPSESASDQQAKPTVLESTQQYYDSVQSLLKNLRSRKGEWKTTGQLGQWFENYGRHVDQLPTLNVDKEMLQYGSYISSQLHGASMGIKGINIQKRVATVAAADSTSPYGGVVGDVSGYGGQSYANQYGGWAYGSYGRYRSTNAAYGFARSGGVQGAINSELRQQQSARTGVLVQAKAQQASGVQQIVQNIESATTQIRQEMTDKYQVQF